MTNWKSPPTDPSKNWLGKSLEIQILLACNWRCCSCDQFSQFPSIAFIKKGTMTVEQIRHFCGEMRQGNAYFGRIRLVGGEPSSHPKFVEIVEVLHNELIVTGHVGVLEMVTNGSMPEKINPVRHLLRVRVSDESDKQKHMTANMVQTPASLGYKGIRCRAPEHCGYSLSVYGFAPCSSGAGIMRLRDLMDRHQRISLPIIKGTENTWPHIQELCDQCYHGLRDEDKIKCGTGQQPGQHALNTPSQDVWENLSPWLSGKQPNWPIYGQKPPMENTEEKDHVGAVCQSPG